MFARAQSDCAQSITDGIDRRATDLAERGPGQSNDFSIDHQTSTIPGEQMEAVTAIGGHFDQSVVDNGIARKSSRIRGSQLRCDAVTRCGLCLEGRQFGPCAGIDLIL
jgi:hypothetical protein